MSDLATQHPASVLEAIADAQPELPALVHGDLRRSWAAFDERASRFAAALGAAGVRRFGPVAMYLRNCPEFLEAHCGALKARCVPININHRYLEDELALVLNDSCCEAVVVHRSFIAVLARVVERVPSLRLIAVVEDAPGDVPHRFTRYEDLLAAHQPASPIKRLPNDPGMFYTGGTTGTPRAVATSIGLRVSGPAVRAAAQALDLPRIPTAYTPEFARWLRSEASPLRSLPLAPLMHGTGLNVLSMPTLMFGGCVVTPSAPQFDAGAALELIARESVTSIAIAGDVMAKPLLDALDRGRGAAHARWDLPCLRAIISSGMAWGHEVMRGLLRALPNVALHEIFGATEAAMATRTVRQPDEIASRTPTFDPVPGLRLMREDGTEIEAGTGEPGLIAVPTDEGRHYHRDVARTASVFRLIDGVRHAVPGDMGALEPDGRLRPIGRGSSVINTGGEKVYPDEVENVIRGLSKVLDCLVIGAPDAHWGKRVCAVVSTRGIAAVTEAEVRSAVRGSLADYKVPKRVLVVPEVPRHANGKVDVGAVGRLLRAAGIGWEADDHHAHG